MVSPAQRITSDYLGRVEPCPDRPLLAPAPYGLKIPARMHDGGDALGPAVARIAGPDERRDVSAAHDGLPEHVDAVVQVAHFGICGFVGGGVPEREADAVLCGRMLSFS